ncbi:hypothetical protein Q7C36_008271 [Tachysurus vachellii]|uniref:S100P-binding protein n=1 Tax=Tachysurus vachellii TaxID=175792 RepID=A0AA88NG87_TACVA|nr:hypothetical protein Q7C36_008271 [Tachysurus vachellii]
MADRKEPVKAISYKGSDKKYFQHLKPLSIYSRMVYCKAFGSCSGNRSLSPDEPSWTLTVEFGNSRASVGRKRRLDDSCLDDTYDTPPKKPCLDKRSSPDSASVLESFGTFRKVKLVTPQPSTLALDRIKRVEKTLSDQESLGLSWIDGSDKTDGQSSVSFSDVHSSSPVILHKEVIAFDCDVDEIMCLSPIDTADVRADGLEDFIQSYQSSYEEQRQAEKRCSSRQIQGKAECSLGRDDQTGSDEGYVTKSFFTPEPGETKDTTESEISKNEELNFTKSYKMTISNLSNDRSPPVSIPIASTPLDKSREFVRRTPLSPKLNLEKASWSSPAIIRQPVKDSSAVSLSAYVNLAADYTEASTTIPFSIVNEGKEANVPREGTTAIHKSLVCRDQENRTAIRVREDVRSVSQQQAASDIQVMFREETDSEDSFNDSLPLQVQVKSKVVLPNKQQPEAVKAPAHQQPASDGRRNAFRDVPRPVVLYREEDWEKKKEVYVDSVTRHITDNVKDGVMTELFHLMNTVANQDRAGDGRKWQHPSDLTRRNYRLRNTGRLLSLDEWQILNFRNHRRFVKVPQVFRRSSVH